MKLMMIMNSHELAVMAVNCGVDRIFVDLEINGKFERQGHRDTLISKHTFKDVENIRRAVPEAELLVRLNPLYEGSCNEIDRAISLGADILMLPMFKGLGEIEAFCKHVSGRVDVIPLVETVEAAAIADAVAKVDGVTELYIGLNDLHMAMGKAFMFELLADGTVDRLASQIHASGKPFGFGGVARVGEGLLPAEKILAEHVRLGSSSVILSRTFHRQADTPDKLREQMDFKTEIQKIRDAITFYRTNSADVLLANTAEVKAMVAKIAHSMALAA